MSLGFPDGGTSESEMMIKTTLEDNPKVQAYQGRHQIKAGESLDPLVANHTNREVRSFPEMTVAEASPVIDQVQGLLEVEEDNIVVSVCEVAHDNGTAEGDLPTDSDGVNTNLPPGIKLDGLSYEEEAAVKALLDKDRQVFSQGTYDVGKCEIHELTGDNSRRQAGKAPVFRGGEEPPGERAKSASTSGLRRSDRVSKGVNPNPGRLPVSSITGLPNTSLSV